MENADARLLAFESKHLPRMPGFVSEELGNNFQFVLGIGDLVARKHPSEEDDRTAYWRRGDMEDEVVHISVVEERESGSIDDVPALAFRFGQVLDRNVLVVVNSELSQVDLAFVRIGRGEEGNRCGGVRHLEGSEHNPFVRSFHTHVAMDGRGDNIP
jgi:hypothetical protein